MKTVFKYPFVICLLLLIGSNQLSAHATAESVYPTLVNGQQFLGNSDVESIDPEQNFNAKSLLPTTVELPSLEVSEFEAEEKHSTFVKLGPYFTVFFKSAANPHYSQNIGLSPFFEKHLSFPSSRRYLLFEVFRI